MPRFSLGAQETLFFLPHRPSCKGTAPAHWGRRGSKGLSALPAGETDCSSSAGATRRELAGWPSCRPWLLPTGTCYTQTVGVPARLGEKNDLNFFLLLDLFYFVLSFSLLFFIWEGGYSEWAGPPGRDTATSVGIFLIPGTQRLQPLSG